MAGIFLSYAREDAATAKALARWLERSGHDVWWDRHLHGGNEFSGEIEAALQRSDLILVLWSQAAMRSAWVRDEAAEGRDSGRLVPLLLDDGAPPLGFRQLHSISIAGWSGRGNPPEHRAILAAIAARTGADSAPRDDSAKSRSPLARRPMMVMAAALALIVAAVAAWLVIDRRSASAQTPVLAVLPFADLSPTRDKAYFTEGVAEAILTMLAREPGIKVIGRSSAEQLQAARGNVEQVRKALGVTHVVEGSARSVGDQLRMSVRLIDASDGSQLWAEEYRRRMDNIFAVQDEIGRAVAKRLSGSFNASATAAQQLTAADTYALYLAARSRMRERKLASLNEALALARRVIAADPGYAPGHAVLAETIWLLNEDSYGTIPLERARRLAEPHARKAIELAPKAADGYAALGLLLATGPEGVAYLRRAAELDPARADVRNWLGQALNEIGRNDEALEQYRAVNEIEPLWAPGVSIHAYTLAASQRYDEALEVVSEFERRGGSPARANKMRGDIANYRGDYSEALRLTLLALRQDPDTPLADLSAGWFYHVLGFPGRTRAHSKNLPVFTGLYMAYDYDGLVAEVRKSGAAIWELMDSRMAIEALAHRRDWGAIEALFDSHPKGGADLCARRAKAPLMLHLATALQKAGRDSESRQLLACHQAAIARESHGSVRSAYYPTSQMELARAQFSAIAGRADQAFDHVDRAIAAGWRTPVGRGLSEHPTLDPYRSSPRYAAADARLKRLIAVERAQALQFLGK